MVAAKAPVLCGAVARAAEGAQVDAEGLLEGSVRFGDGQQTAALDQLLQGRRRAMGDRFVQTVEPHLLQGLPGCAAMAVVEAEGEAALAHPEAAGHTGDVDRLAVVVIEVVDGLAHQGAPLVTAQGHRPGALAGARAGGRADHGGGLACTEGRDPGIPSSLGSPCLNAMPSRTGPTVGSVAKLNAS